MTKTAITLFSGLGSSSKALRDLRSKPVCSRCQPLEGVY